MSHQTIPGIIVDFLGRASAAVASTRDKNLVPHVHPVSGWKVSDDRREITCFIPQNLTRALLSSLEDNGRFALTVSSAGLHETYQFKGEYLDSRPVREEDVLVYQDCRERFVSACLKYYNFPQKISQRYQWKPDIAIRFGVQEIYIQTPGPSAGKRLVPREE